jgi:hypothetical protein
MIIDACCFEDRGLTSILIWALPEVRAWRSHAGVPGVRAAFISPKRNELPAVLTTWLRTMRGGSQRNGK